KKIIADKLSKNRSQRLAKQLFFPVPTYHPMRTNLLVYSSALMLAIFSLGSLHAQNAGAVKAYTGARIINGTGSRPIENGVLVVRNGRIEAVGPANEVKVPAGAEQISL